MYLEPTIIVKRPVVTEKAAQEAMSANRYTFEVDLRADKPQIKAAVEALYGVSVAKINTQIRKGEFFRHKHGVSRSKTWKKAIVTLAEGQKIEIF